MALISYAEMLSLFEKASSSQNLAFKLPLTYDCHWSKPIFLKHWLDGIEKIVAIGCDQSSPIYHRGMLVTNSVNWQSSNFLKKNGINFSMEKFFKIEKNLWH